MLTCVYQGLCELKALHGPVENQTSIGVTLPPCNELYQRVRPKDTDSFFHAQHPILLSLPIYSIEAINEASVSFDLCGV
jgi:hypothetical protein